MFSIELEAQVRAGVSELPGQASKQALSLLQYSVVTSMQYCAEKGSPVDYSVLAAAAEQSRVQVAVAGVAHPRGGRDDPSSPGAVRGSCKLTTAQRFAVRTLVDAKIVRAA